MTSETVQLPSPETEHAGLELADVEHVVDHVVEVFGPVADHVEHPLLLFVERADDAIAQAERHTR